MFFNKITDERFKVNQIVLYFFTDYGENSEISRSDHAAAAYILTDCCKKFPTHTALSRYLSSLYGASLTSSAVTGQVWDKRCTYVKFSFIDNSCTLSGENLEAEMCGLIRECLLSPIAENGEFDEKITDFMKSELIDTIDSVINDKASFAAQNASKTAFCGEPQETPALGTHEQAERVTAKSAYNAYLKMLKTARVEIFAAGKSDFYEAERVLSGIFDGLPRENICELCVAPSPLKAQPAEVSDKFTMKQAILRMYFKAPDFSDRYAATMLAMILGGMTTSRFFENIREKQSLCYYCACSNNRNKRTITAYAGVEPKNIERTKAAILAEIEDIRQNGVSGEEIKTAMLEISNQISTLYDSAAALSGWYLNQLTDGGFATPEEYFAQISEVTSQRIQNAARAYSLDTVYTLSGEE